VMEPLRGGSLTRPAPSPVVDLWNTALIQRTQADWALQWVWNQPEVSLLLSGMSEMQHVEENLKSASKSGIGTLTAEELVLVDRVSKAYRVLSPIPCTDCKYCMPCPSDVAIPNIFSIYNGYKMYGDEEGAKRSYNQFMKPENRADQCVECGQCEQACPQQIEIIDWLKKAHAFLAETAAS
jgi:uncharacterized protein